MHFLLVFNKKKCGVLSCQLLAFQISKLMWVLRLAYIFSEISCVYYHLFDIAMQANVLESTKTPYLQSL